MRKLFLIMVLVSGYCLPTFSQSDSQLQIDTIKVKFGILNSTKIPGNFDTIDFTQFLNNTECHKYKLDPKLAANDVHFGQLSNGKISAPQYFDNMPCLYPQGSFPMPVCKPDSTLKYSLLIKKY
jgi:hypothetical protein